MRINAIHRITVRAPEMNRASSVLTGLFVLLTCSHVFASSPGDELQPHRTIDAWPKMVLSLGVMYSPAPWLIGTYNREHAERKLLDQAGSRISADWRFMDYLLLGGFLDILGNKGSMLFEVGLRAGAILPVDEDWCLYGLTSLGIASFDTEKYDHVVRWDKSFFGWNFGLSLGARYRFATLFGAFMEVTGMLNRFTETSMIAGEDHFSEPYLYRLEIVLGVLFHMPS